MRRSEVIRCGWSLNVPIPVPVAYHSFGGWRASLFGDLHMYWPDGIQFYRRAKVVTGGWPDPGTISVDLGFPRTRRATPRGSRARLNGQPSTERVGGCQHFYGG